MISLLTEKKCQREWILELTKKILCTQIGKLQGRCMLNRPFASMVHGWPMSVTTYYYAGGMDE